MTKRDMLEQLLTARGRWDYVPAAFFMHFGVGYKEGLPAVRRHLDYFRATDMDFVKVQYEQTFEPVASIRTPKDWKDMPSPGLDFYEEQFALLKGIIAEAKPEALIIQTLYSPYMSAGHATSDSTVQAHLTEDPESVRPGFEKIAESLLRFVQECIRIGVDGFYMSTQGGESGRFEAPGIFEHYIAPWDLLVMEEASRCCPFNILHVCDYHRAYDSFEAFHDYPGSVVNLPHRTADGKLTNLAASCSVFDRPMMGGLDKRGALASGDLASIGREVRAVLADRPPRFILGADCTVSGSIPWEHVRSAVDLAHNSVSRRLR